MSDLSINVADSINTAESMGGADFFQKIFKNPKNDPKIAGMCQVADQKSLEQVCPWALEYSKQQGKPVIIVVSAKT
jgi:hypothetical protein